MFSNILKFILGFILAIAVLIGTGATVALYFLNRTGISPPKPVFANDASVLKSKKSKVINIKASNVKATSISKPDTSPSPKSNPTKSATTLPAGAYRGQITWPTGLRLRTEPKSDAERVGSVSGNQKVIILEESQDKAWQKIRVEGSNQEGWVKAVNTKRIDEETAVQKPKNPAPDEQTQDQ